MCTSQICETGVSSCHGNRIGRRGHIDPGAARGFEEALEEACSAPERPSGETAHNKAGTCKMKEVSINDPWPEDHPLRDECDEFMEMFKERYKKILSEKGLLGDSGNCDPLIISQSDLDEVCQEMIKGLATDPRAVSLMTELRIDFTLDGDMSAMPEERALQLYDAVKEPVLDERGLIDFEAFKRNAKRALSLGIESMATAMAEVGHTRLVLPYSFSPGQCPDYPGDAAGRDEMNKFTNKIHASAYEYYKLMKRAENEVLADLGLSPLDYAPDDPKNIEAVKLVGQKLMDNPRARELMAVLGLTSVNQFGLPTAAGLEDHDAMTLDGERLAGLPGYSEDEWFNGLKDSGETIREAASMRRGAVTLFRLFKSSPQRYEASIESHLLKGSFPWRA